MDITTIPSFLKEAKTSFADLNSNIILKSLKNQLILEHDNRSRVLKAFSCLILVFEAKSTFLEVNRGK